MQTLVLGTSDTRRPFEEVVRDFGADELRVLESDGTLRGYFSPALPLDHALYAQFQELFLNDADELLRHGKDRGPGISTAQLLRQLHEMAPAEEE